MEWVALFREWTERSLHIASAFSTKRYDRRCMTVSHYEICLGQADYECSSDGKHIVCQSQFCSAANTHCFGEYFLIILSRWSTSIILINRRWTLSKLTHWSRVTYICVSNLTIIGPDNGLSPGRRQAIIWTNAEILLIVPLGTNFIEILIEIHTFHWRKYVWKFRLRNVVHFVSTSMC